MSWFADLAGKAESLLNDLDEQTGAALRSNVLNNRKNKIDKNEIIPAAPSTNVAKRKIRPVKKPTVSEPKTVSTALNVTPLFRTKESSTRPPTRAPSPSKASSPTRASSPNRIKSLSPPKKSTTFSLEKYPQMMAVEHEYEDTPPGLRQRKLSLPTSFDLKSQHRIEIVEMENKMFKSEIQLMNKELSELLELLSKREDGKSVVDSRKEVNKMQSRLDDAQKENLQVTMDKDAATEQLEMLRNKINYLTVNHKLGKNNQQLEQLEKAVENFKMENEKLLKSIKTLTNTLAERSSNQMKLENELRHAQSVIGDLQSNLEKSKAECGRLEEDWDAYKLRVKSMLNAKDKEIKSLQAGDGQHENEDFVAQLEVLKEQKEELLETVSSLRGECSQLRLHNARLQSLGAVSERAATALREVLREQRARSDLTQQALKQEQMESVQVIDELRETLREKEQEIAKLRESLARSESALNVGDYEPNIDQNKIKYLTHELVQRQQRVDALVAKNNALRIQMDKLECKLRAEVCVPVPDTARARRGPTLWTVAALLTRHALCRAFLLLYMVCLHLWVITVLFTSTPEDYIARPPKA